jgi:hypothetical protein
MKLPSAPWREAAIGQLTRNSLARGVGEIIDD